MPAEVWARTQLVFVCSPGNPTGSVMSLNDWQDLFELSDRYGFVIASDECYSEIYLTRRRWRAGSRRHAGRDDFANLVMFTSLSRAPMCRACARALPPATPACWRNSCSTAPTMVRQ